MIQNAEISYQITGHEVSTKGFAKYDLPELRVNVNDESLTPEGEAFLRYVVKYMKGQKVRIKPNETIAYGYWLVRFQQSDEWFLDAWEYNGEGTEYVIGAKLALTYWRDQHAICKKKGADFLPPRADQLVVLSSGVLEGDSVQGVRYPSPPQMSGWWITTDRYDGNMKSLIREHMYHLTAARPDLARFIALPYGYRFDLAQQEDIWFDSDVASESAQ